MADRAHIESDDVAALSVFSTGDSASSDKNTRMDDFSVCVPVKGLADYMRMEENFTDDPCFAASGLHESTQGAPMLYNHP